MKILVTGHKGFIGGHFFRMFKDKYNLTGFDKKDGQALCGDLTGIMEDIDIAINFAVKKISKILNVSFNVDFIPDKIARPGHDRRYDINPTKMRKLGWRPVYTLKQGLPEVVEWYKQRHQAS